MNSKSLSWIGLLIPIAALVIASSVNIASGASATTETVAMHALNNSGQRGTAAISDLGGKVRVVVNIANEPADASEPSHVHFGHCPEIKAVPAYNVGPIVNGKASSVVNLSWAQINSGKYVVMVHRSAHAMGTYESCANIGRPASPHN